MSKLSIEIRSFFETFEDTLKCKVYSQDRMERYSLSYLNCSEKEDLKFVQTGIGKPAASFLYDTQFDVFTELLLEQSEVYVRKIKEDPETMDHWLPIYNLAREIMLNETTHPFYFLLLEVIVNAYKRKLHDQNGQLLPDDYFVKIAQSYVTLKNKFYELMSLYEKNETSQSVFASISENEDFIPRHPLTMCSEFILTEDKEKKLQAVLYPEMPEDIWFYLVPQYMESNLRFKRCESCMRFFVTTNQSNARFCEHLIEGRGRTCRQLMPKVNLLIKSEKDPAEWLFNRAYKTMYSRVTAGTISKASYKEWSKAARAKRNECSKGLMSPEEYSTWLCESGLFIDYLKDM